MADILIASGIGLFTAFMAFMGMYVTFHPPNTRRVKWGWIIVFGATAVASCVLIAWQTKRNIDVQDALQSQLDVIRRNTETPPHVTIPLTVNTPNNAEPPQETTAH